MATPYTGIAYVIESYGLITNKTLLEKAGYTIDDIQSFADLKEGSRRYHSTLSMNLDLRHLPLQVWTDLLTGDLRHTLQTFQSTLSIRQMESDSYRCNQGNLP